MKYEDYERPPCTCPDCVQAGVAELPQIREWSTGVFLHAYDLKRWYAARDAFWETFREQLPKRAMPSASREREA